MLPWVYWLVFASAAVLVDRFVTTMSPATRRTFRTVVLVLAFLWILVLTGVLARMGIV